MSYSRIVRVACLYLLLALPGCHLLLPLSTSPDASLVTDGPPPFLTGWRYRKSVSITSTVVTEPLPDFPLLVTLSDPELASAALGNGDDIVFTASDGRILAREIESYAKGTLVAWVKVPRLTGLPPTRLYLYYGNPSPPPLPDPRKVWSNGYRGVWHLTSSAIKDSSLAQNHGMIKGGVTGADGLINGALAFDAEPTSWVEMQDGPMAGDAPFTVEAWFRPTSLQNRFVGIATKGRKSNYQWVYINSSHELCFGWSTYLSGNNGNLDGAPIVAGRWHHGVATFDGTWMRLYHDGTLEAGPKRNSYEAINEELALGTDRNDNNPSIDGKIDEVRISNVPRSAAWIAAQHANQLEPSKFYSVGVQEDSADY